MVLFEQFERPLQARHDTVEYRLVDEMQRAEHLECVAQMLAGRFDGGIPLGAGAALQGAASLAPRLGTSVDAMAAVGKQTGGGHDAGNVAPAGNSIQKRLPRPRSDSTPALPPMRAIALRTMARPIPVPG